MGYIESAIMWYQTTLAVVAEKLSEERGFAISSEMVGLALVEQKGFLSNIQLYDYVYDRGLSISYDLVDFYFPLVIGSVKIENIEGEDEFINEAKIKNNGEVWVIHQNDKDPWPSSPHAHNYEKGIKLDLKNGNIYKNNKKIDSTLSRKRLLVIRAEIEKNIKNIYLPTLDY